MENKQEERCNIWRRKCNESILTSHKKKYQEEKITKKNLSYLIKE